MTIDQKWKQRYEAFAEHQNARGIDLQSVKKSILAHHIETPSWGYADSGTRFGTFKQPGAARTAQEKLADAALVHRLTGVCPSVALHIPWDKVDDYAALSEYAASLGVTLGAINPNLFQETEYKMGSLCNPSEFVRAKALEHCYECVEIMQKTNSKNLSMWLADGTDYPGQDNMRERKHRLEECLRAICSRIPDGSRMLVEYKMFEPSFYTTDIPDWGVSYSLCRKLGDKAEVLIDLGHHAQGTNIEFIVAYLLDEGKLGGFHFNNRKYADDDLTVGCINPYEVFLIYRELVDAWADPKLKPNVAFMLDQSHIMKPKIEAMLQSVVFLQETYAKALLVHAGRLAEAQAAGDTIAAEEELKAGYDADVKPLLAMIRIENGMDPEPILAFRKSGYMDKIIKERSK